MLLDLITLTTSVGEYKWWSSSLCNFLHIHVKEWLELYFNSPIHLHGVVPS